MSLVRVGLCIVGVVLGGPLLSRAGDWPQWRGPKGTGVSRESGLPLHWTEEKGIEWRCALPEWGTSTPAIRGDSIFVTSHEGDRLLLLKISKKARAIEWTREVGRGEAPRRGGARSAPGAPLGQKFHATQNLASPSPVTDGEVVAVHFGNGDLAAYDAEGNRLWKRNLQDDHGTYTIWWGHANSPVLYGKLLISICMQDSLTDLRETPSPSYVVAHDKRTGKEVYKTMRMTGVTSEPCDAYTTPLFRDTPDGPEMIVVGGTWADAYDPLTGERLWYLPELGGNRTITGPTLAHGMLYLTVGMRGPLLAVRLGPKGRLPRSAIAWQHEESTPDTPSPVVWEDLLFIVNDGGVAACLDAKTGKRLWRQKLRGEYRASPLAAEGRVYFTNMKGLTTVVAAEPEFRLLAENQVDDSTIASLAVSDGRLYLRGRKSLYCLR